MCHKSLVSDEAANHLSLLQIVHMDQSVIGAGQQPGLRTIDAIIRLLKVFAAETLCILRKSGLIGAVEMILKYQVCRAKSLLFSKLFMTAKFVNMHVSVNMRSC